MKMSLYCNILVQISKFSIKNNVTSNLFCHVILINQLNFFLEKTNSCKSQKSLKNTRLDHFEREKNGFNITNMLAYYKIKTNCLL